MSVSSKICVFSELKTTKTANTEAFIADFTKTGVQLFAMTMLRVAKKLKNDTVLYTETGVEYIPIDQQERLN